MQLNLINCQRLFFCYVCFTLCYFNEYKFFFQFDIYMRILLSITLFKAWSYLLKELHCLIIMVFLLKCGRPIAVGSWNSSFPSFRPGLVDTNFISIRKKSPDLSQIRSFQEFKDKAASPNYVIRILSNVILFISYINEIFLNPFLQL